MRETIAVLAFVLFAAFGVAQTESQLAGFYDGADVVFTGTVQNVDSSSASILVSFEIAKPIEGLSASTRVLTVEAPGESRCYGFEQYHRYLVYARRMGDSYWADPCAGSKLISAAELDLRYIHGLKPEISEQCSDSRLAYLFAKSPVVATAEVIGTEDSLADSPLIWRPWCGLAWSAENAY